MLLLFEEQTKKCKRQPNEMESVAFGNCCWPINCTSKIEAATTLSTRADAQPSRCPIHQISSALNYKLIPSIN